MRSLESFEMRVSPFILAFVVFVACAAQAFGADYSGRSIEVSGIVYAGDLETDELRVVAEGFETIRRGVRALDPGRAFDLPFPLRVMALKDPGALKRFSAGDSFVVDGKLTRFIVFRFGDKAAEGEAYRAFVRLLIDNELGPAATPPWLRAGLAGHFATFRRVDGLRGEFGPTERPRPFSIDELMATDHWSANSQTPEATAIFELRAAAVVRSLLRRDAGRFAALFAAYDAGKPDSLALRDSFGADLADLVPPALVADPASAFPIEISPIVGDPERVTVPQQALIDAEILLGLGQLVPARSALAKAPTGAASMTIEALICDAERRFGAAGRLYASAIASDPNDHRPYFAWAASLIARETTEFGLASFFSTATAERVRANLLKAIELAPRFGDSYELLAFLNSVRNERIPETIDLIRVALRIAPGSSWYRMRHAELMISDRDFANARRILLTLIRTAREKRMRLYAENTLARLNSFEAQLASLKDRRGVNSDIVTDAPLDEAELARRRARAINEAINLALRIPKPGEKRVVGVIGFVKCLFPKIEVTVALANEKLTLLSPSFEAVELTSFVDDLAGTEFGCGTPTRPTRAVITFVPSAVRAGEGRLVAVEFVPDSFTLSESERR